MRTSMTSGLIDSLDFEGVLRLEVTDRAGNVAVVETEIKEAVVRATPSRTKGKRASSAKRSKSSPSKSKSKSKKSTKRRKR